MYTFLSQSSYPGLKTTSILCSGSFFKSLKSEMRIKVRIYNSENVYINNHNNNSHINDQNKMIIIMKGDNDDINNYNNNDI